MTSMTKREELLKLLSECTKGQIHYFKRLYSHENLDLPVEDVIKNMDAVSISLEKSG